jgi:site-specific DNA-methyltransferase (adenine-specific)
MIIIGDCINGMSRMAPQSVQCCVTSPPYFGLRDYGHDGQIGLEQTPDEYVAKLVDVFREVKRVLRDDGTLWLNLGDSYAASATGSLSTLDSKMTGGRANQEAGSKRPDKTGFGLAAKQLIGIPWRVAFALQADGWYLRQDIIWHKSNPMPESVKDRCTKAHEYVFLLSKSAKYFYDADAVCEIGTGRPRFDNNSSRAVIDASRNDAGRHNAEPAETRNRRSVWSVSTKPFKGAHFAVMPEELVEPCILAGSRMGDTVLDPFFGSGTVGVVATRLGRKYVGCELNPKYAQIAKQRLACTQDSMRISA